MIRGRGDAEQALRAVAGEFARLNVHRLLGILKFPVKSLRQRVGFHVAAQLHILALGRANNHHFIGGTNWYELHFQQELIAHCFALRVQCRARIFAR